MISKPSNFVVLVTPGICLAANPARIKVIFSNITAVNIYLSMGAPELSATKAIVLPGGAVLVDEPDRNGRFFRGDWYCISAAGGETLLIDEVVE